MKLNLSIKSKSKEAISKTLPVPCTFSMWKTIDDLKKVCDPHEVNEKIREALQSLIDQNKDKLDKAS